MSAVAGIAAFAGIRSALPLRPNTICALSHHPEIGIAHTSSAQRIPAISAIPADQPPAGNHPRLGALTEAELAEARDWLCQPDRTRGMTDTVLTTFTITELHRRRATGNPRALATVEVNLDGIAITLSGIEVVLTANGKLQARAARHRTAAGAWAPCVVLPSELERAIGRDILDAFADPSA